jgi:hypothetical protein
LPRSSAWISELREGNYPAACFFYLCRMEETRTVLQFKDLTVEVETFPGEELIDHMHSTVLGQPGSFRYCHMDLEERLMAPGENYFMYLRKNGKMLGSVGFLGRHTESGGVAHDSWMIRYFSIKAPLGSAPKKRKEKEDIKDENQRTSVLGRFIHPVFEAPVKLRGEEADRQGPAIIYALIEQKNLRSMNFSVQMGLETVSEVANFSFSRLRPRSSRRIEVLAEHEQEEMLSLLSDFYREYLLFFPDPLFRDQGYYVIRDAGGIVAGLQVYPVRWHIIDFGGGMANRVIALLTKIPWIRRRVNPEEMKLMAFDGIYCKNGHEDALYELMEGVLEQTGTYLAVLMMDKQSGLYRIFREHRKLGLLHRLIGDFSAEVRARFIHMPEEVRQQFHDRPIYIPTYDNS